MSAPARKSGARRQPPTRPPLSLDDEATWLKGAGPAVAAKLGTLGIARVADVLFHLPLRYEDRRRPRPIASLLEGEGALVVGRVTACDARNAPRRSLHVLVEDEGGALLLRFFHFGEAQRRNLRVGCWLQAYGTLRASAQALEMIHPEYRVADDRAGLTLDVGWIPVYPTTAGLGQTRLRSLVARALEVAARDASLVQSLPGFDGPSTLDALRILHQPSVEIDAQTLLDRAHPARLRLIEEELLAHQLAMRQSRARIRKRHAARLPTVERAAHRLQEHLSFAPTGAQRRAIAEIAADLASGVPMLRLLQGDVGSGKTLVAATAMLACADAGLQAVLMAPTELLAEQHLRTLTEWFAPLRVSVGLLSGKMAAKPKREALAAAAAGAIQIWVGTHALIQASVAFKQLALVVVDEQHRFGVAQRLALTEKTATTGLVAHQLIMSATPIPRTLAQTVYADLDVSIIDELPPGRTPTVTVILREERRAEVLARVGAACRDGRQAYWVCTLIEESEQLQAQTAEETFARLQVELPDLHVGLVHGRMKPSAKDAQMRAFAECRTQVLVATTVIEVGVDVPNASIMVIDNAERLGLAQLHQLRGRVGRGARESQCVLMCRLPLADTARSRLEVMRSTHDGFRIAERDLELRGPGELLGRRQTGMVGLKVADPIRDAASIPLLRRRADDWLARRPALARQLIHRWLGRADRYARV